MKYFLPIFILSLFNVIDVSAQKYSKNNKNFQNIDSTIIIIKFKNFKSSTIIEHTFSDVQLNNLLKSIDEYQVGKAFPHYDQKNEKTWNENMIDLSLIYFVKFKTKIINEFVLNKLNCIEDIDYAHYYYIPEVLSTTNDPLFKNQYYLRKIKAIEAWDIEEGKDTIVIGIVDTGSDLLHPDLVDNIKYNHIDPIDGIDNDNDGFLDNYRGWDLGENDNNPQVNLLLSQGGHGVNVSGIAAAKTNNNAGIAGVANKCKFLPIKVQDAQGNLTMAYQGIVYAADHGCQIINCSWGSIGYAGQFGQDVINYATYNRNALVIAAAGNSNQEDDFYPASYQNVISVANVDSFDLKYSYVSGGSTYSHKIDLSAPGTQMQTTSAGGMYTYTTGTSDAAPVVAGCAALVRAKYPKLSAIQVGELLKVTSDFIDTLPFNLPYAKKIGAGRVNVFNALSSCNKPSIQMLKLNQLMEFYGNKRPGDTVTITADFINYLSPVDSVAIKLICNNQKIDLIDSSFYFSNFDSLEINNNNSNPFKLVLKNNLENSANIEFLLEFSGNNYYAFQAFSIVFNLNYLTLDTGLIATTITSVGRIGYNDFENIQGIGFKYKNSNSLLSNASFIIGNANSKISDNCYSSQIGFVDNDFFSLVSAHHINSGFNDVEEIFSQYNDENAGSSKLNVMVTQKSIGFASAPNENFIILKYIIKNKSISTLNNVYAGIFADWDIQNYNQNKMMFNADKEFGYAYSADFSTYVGIKKLSDGITRFYAFDNNGFDGSINLTDGFSSSEKYNALKNTPPTRSSAGTFGNGNDVSMMISAGPFTISPSDSIEVAYALMAGDNLNDLISASDNAQSKFNLLYGIDYYSDKKNLQNGFSIIPNPAFEFTNIIVEVFEKGQYLIEIADLNGKMVYLESENVFTIGKYNLSIPLNSLGDGIYIVKLIGENTCVTKKLCVLRSF